MLDALTRHIVAPKFPITQLQALLWGRVGSYRGPWLGNLLVQDVLPHLLVFLAAFLFIEELRPSIMRLFIALGHHQLVVRSHSDRLRFTEHRDDLFLVRDVQQIQLILVLYRRRMGVRHVVVLLLELQVLLQAWLRHVEEHWRNPGVGLHYFWSHHMGLDVFR